MTRTEIGKIRKVKFGFGGYQDAQFGVSFDIGSDKLGWGVGDFRGYWATEHDKRCKWSEQDRLASLGETCMWLSKILNDAKVSDISKLIGIPVEVTFDGNTLKSWRVLTEVI